jgi:aryl sulfotransferase
VIRTIWLASYPKSGNTWMRTLLGNVLAQDGEPTGIEAIVCGQASDRTSFDFVTLLDSGLLTHDEVDYLRPRTYRAIASGDYDDCFTKTEAARSVRFIKAHEAYMKTPSGEKLLGGSQGARGAIVLVRDPRDVVASWAYHQAVSTDDAIATINNDDSGSILGAKTTGQEMQFRQRLLSWSSHAASWLDQTDFPVCLIRYEDLLKDTVGTLSSVLDFAGVVASADKINRAAQSCAFVLLRDEERRNGFAEAPRPGIKFFRRGEAGGWRDELNPEQILRIETHHWRMMQRLGYGLSCISDLGRAG